MAEAFEEGGDAVEAGAAGVHPPQHRLQLVRDPLLLGEGSEDEGCRFSCFCAKAWHIQPVANRSDVLQKSRMLQPVGKVTILKGAIGSKRDDLGSAVTRLVGDEDLVQVGAELPIENVTSLKEVLRTLGFSLCEGDTRKQPGSVLLDVFKLQNP